MNKYKYELHAHTSEISPCAIVPAESVARIYAREGYDGIVITDHFCEYTVEPSNDPAVWRQRVARFISGYEKVKREADMTGVLTVLFGLEYRFVGEINDFLIFGMTPEMLLGCGCGDIICSHGKLREFADRNGLLIVQAHPCRSMCSKSEAELLDGVEVYNGNPRHNSHNDEADAFARENSLIRTSGSDFHEPQDAARGGIVTNETIKSDEQLVKLLLSGEYKLIETK